MIEVVTGVANGVSGNGNGKLVTAEFRHFSLPKRPVTVGNEKAETRRKLPLPVTVTA